MLSRTVGWLLYLGVGTLAGCAVQASDDPGDTMAEGSSELRSREPSSAGLSMSVLASPHSVTTTDERQHLVYETLLQNTGTTDVRLERLDVFGGAAREPLVSYTRDNADNVIFPVNAPTLEPFAPGAIAIVFVDVTVPLRAPIPARLRQRVTATGVDGTSRVATFDVPVEREAPIELDLPLVRSRLLDLNGCCNGGHTRAALQFSDGVFVAQRFAIDFVQLSDTAVTTFEGDPKSNQSYFLYGAEVRAAAAGRIVAVRDGMVENTPTEPLPAFDYDTAAGNYVIEKFDDHHFALYAHLKPGHIRVNVGDRVGAGCILGLVGNSGNSTEPHLHFHVMDRPSPLDANGLPYVFNRFRLTATLEVTPAGLGLKDVSPPTSRRDRLPLVGDVLSP